MSRKLRTLSQNKVSLLTMPYQLSKHATKVSMIIYHPHSATKREGMQVLSLLNALKATLDLWLYAIRIVILDTHIF